MLVYIREAHAVDGELPIHEGPIVEDPITDAERGAVAGTCVESLDLPMVAVLDRVDDKVNRAYGGWPDRLYLVGRDGRIAYAGGPGPRGFALDELEAAIRRELAAPGVQSAPTTRPVAR